jgi:hypothetical protein
LTDFQGEETVRPEFEVVIQVEGVPRMASLEDVVPFGVIVICQILELQQKPVLKKYIKTH